MKKLNIFFAMALMCGSFNVMGADSDGGFEMVNVGAMGGARRGMQVEKKKSTSPVVIPPYAWDDVNEMMASMDRENQEAARELQEKQDEAKAKQDVEKAKALEAGARQFQAKQDEAKATKEEEALELWNSRKKFALTYASTAVSTLGNAMKIGATTAWEHTPDTDAVTTTLERGAQGVTTVSITLGKRVLNKMGYTNGSQDV
jgi:hypothetical protein